MRRDRGQAQHDLILKTFSGSPKMTFSMISAELRTVFSLRTTRVIILLDQTEEA